VQVTPAVFDAVEEGDRIRDRLPAIQAALYAPTCCPHHHR
jgi:hypothetical protein